VPGPPGRPPVPPELRMELQELDRRLGRLERQVELLLREIRGDAPPRPPREAAPQRRGGEQGEYHGDERSPEGRQRPANPPRERLEGPPRPRPEGPPIDRPEGARGRDRSEESRGRGDGPPRDRPDAPPRERGERPRDGNAW
jgi:hypothetical protein